MWKVKTTGAALSWLGLCADANAPPTVIGMAAGDHHNLVLAADGTVWAWDRNGEGQLGDSTTTDRSTPVQVAGLTHHPLRVE